MGWINEFWYVHLLRNIGIVSAVTGIIIGLDLIFGAPIVSFLKRLLEKSYDFDKIITNPRVKIGLGAAFIILSAIIFLLIKRL